MDCSCVAEGGQIIIFFFFSGGDGMTAFSSRALHPSLACSPYCNTLSYFSILLATLPPSIPFFSLSLSSQLRTPRLPCLAFPLCTRNWIYLSPYFPFTLAKHTRLPHKKNVISVRRFCSLKGIIYTHAQSSFLYPLPSLLSSQ